MTQSAGTWRRLKLAAEARQGHPLPSSLPAAEVEKLVGLLAGIRDGRGREVVESEDLQAELGRKETAKTSRPQEKADAALALARLVDARAWL